jgi:hypothetical protein
MVEGHLISARLIISVNLNPAEILYCIIKEYLKFFNRLYNITWLREAYAS